MRLLIVEDEPKVARFIERGLKEEHYAVDVVACNSPGKLGGSWTAKNLYNGGKCTTATFNLLPSDGHFSSNSLPAA